LERSRAMKRTGQAVLLVAVPLLLLSAGCYTVMRHPTGDTIIAEGTYYRSCSDCHADASFYHPYGRPFYNYGRSHYAWGGYYGSPWWYDDYWWWDNDYDHHHDYEYEGPEVETGTRHLWGSSGWPSSGWGFNPPTYEPVVPQQPQEPTESEGPKLKDAEERPIKERHMVKPPVLRPLPDKEKQKAEPAPKPRVLKPEQLKKKSKNDDNDTKPARPDGSKEKERAKVHPRTSQRSGS
jgi:hypothetical protein